MSDLLQQLPPEYPHREELIYKIKIILSNPQYSIPPHVIDKAVSDSVGYLDFRVSLDPNASLISREQWVRKFEHNIQHNSFTLVDILLFRMEKAKYFKNLHMDIYPEDEDIAKEIIPTDLTTFCSNYQQNYYVVNSIRNDSALNFLVSHIISGDVDGYRHYWKKFVSEYQMVLTMEHPHQGHIIQSLLDSFHRIKIKCAFEIAKYGRTEMFHIVLSEEPRFFNFEDYLKLLYQSLEFNHIELSEQLLKLLHQSEKNQQDYFREVSIDDVEDYSYIQSFLDVLEHLVGNFGSEACLQNSYANLDTLEWFIDRAGPLKQDFRQSLIGIAYENQNFELFVFLKRKLFQDRYLNIYLNGDVKIKTYPMLWLCVKYIFSKKGGCAKFATHVAVCAQKKGYWDLYRNIVDNYPVFWEDILHSCVLQGRTEMAQDILSKKVSTIQGTVMDSKWVGNLKKIVMKGDETCLDIYLKMTKGSVSIKMAYDRILRCAASLGKLNMVKKYTERGAIYFQGAAEKALLRGHPDVFSFLLDQKLTDYGRLLNIILTSKKRDMISFLPIVASRCSQEQLVKNGYGPGRTLEIKKTSNPDTPLFRNKKKLNERLRKFLLQAGDAEVKEFLFCNPGLKVKISKLLLKINRMSLVKTILLSHRDDQYLISSLMFEAAKGEFYHMFKYLMNMFFKIPEFQIWLLYPIFNFHLVYYHLDILLEFQNKLGELFWVGFRSVFEEVLLYVDDASREVIEYFLFVLGYPCVSGLDQLFSRGWYDMIPRYLQFYTYQGEVIKRVRPEVKFETLYDKDRCPDSIIKLGLLRKNFSMYGVVKCVDKHNFLPDSRLRMPLLVALLCGIVQGRMTVTQAQPEIDLFLSEIGYTSERRITPGVILSTELNFLEKETAKVIRRVCQNLVDRNTELENREDLDVLVSNNLITRNMAEMALMYSLIDQNYFYKDCDTVVDESRKFEVKRLAIALSRQKSYRAVGIRYLWAWSVIKSLKLKHTPK